MCVMFAVNPTAQHGSGTFQEEGKDFPRTGNSARDKHAVVTIHVPLLKFLFHSKGCLLFFPHGNGFSVLFLHMMSC